MLNAARWNDEPSGAEWGEYYNDDVDLLNMEQFVGQIHGLEARLIQQRERLKAEALAEEALAEAHERAIEAAEEARRKAAKEALTAAAKKIADIANKIETAAETRNEEASIAVEGARRKAALTAVANKIETAAETRNEEACIAAEGARRKTALTAVANKIETAAETRNEEASIAVEGARRKAALTVVANKIETVAETRNEESSIAAQEAINEADAAAAVEAIEASRMIAATNTIEAAHTIEEEQESVTNAEVDAIIAATKQDEAKAIMQVPAARKPPDEPAAQEDKGSLVELPATALQLAEDQTSTTGLRGYLMYVHKNTDLHIAARDGNVELAQQLLAAGSDVNAKNKVIGSQGGRLDHDHVSAAGQVHPAAQSS